MPLPVFVANVNLTELARGDMLAIAVLGNFGGILVFDGAKSNGRELPGGKAPR
jgi:hypothetical protein